MNIIEVKDLEFEYKNYDDDGNETESSKVLKGINLSIPKGQFVAVLGHNGCGKIHPRQAFQRYPYRKLGQGAGKRHGYRR